MIKALSAVNAVCLLMVVLWVSVEIPTFNPSFYSAEYDKYNIPAQIKVSRDDLAPVTDRLLAYMKGVVPDLVIVTTVAGERREFFNQREKDHMVDVRNLILAGFLARNCAAAFFVVSVVLLALLRVKFLSDLAWAVKRVFIGFLIIAAVLAALVASNFDRAFTIFHEIFFNNNLWILNPDTDLLINIVPLGFFMDISRTIAIIFIAFCAAVIVISFVYTNGHDSRPLAAKNARKARPA